MGGTFATALFVPAVARRGLPVGIIVVLLGFAVQIASSLAESSLLRTISRDV